jgi:ESS family glutamate:Na+ symporter
LLAYVHRMIEVQPGGVVFVRTFLAITIAIVVLFAGKGINGRVRMLREYSIPEPVTGGLLLATALTLVYAIAGWRVTFDLQARDVLLVYFFTTIGLNARLADLKAGGRPLVILLVCVAAFLVLQDAAGIAAAALMGRPPALGLLAGSVSMLGGHGTAIAWAPSFEAHGVSGALEIGVLCATAGLVMASLAGGPLARALVERHRLEPRTDDRPDVGQHYGDPEPGIDYDAFLQAWLAIHLSAGTGVVLHEWLGRIGFPLPLFVPCLLAGLAFTNVLPRLAPRVPWPSRTPALALIAEVSLGVFLAMSLMSMQLWTLAHLAGPLVVLLGLQLALALGFALVVFRALGRNYDAAVVCAGFVGFGLGATPTAMANMTAVTQRYGPSHVAFLVVPLVGAFFIDLMNTFAIRMFVSLL